MLYVMIGSEKVPVPRDVEAQGPGAVQGFIDAQAARQDLGGAEPPRAPRRVNAGVSS